MVAEDIVSEAIIHLWELSKKGEIESVEAILITYIRSKSLNYLKHIRAQENVFQALLDKGQRELEIRISTLEACDPEEILSEELRLKAKSLIENMPERTRTAFILDRLDGKSHKEIAEEMGISVKGVIYALDQVIITSAPKVNRTNTVRYSFLEDPVFDTWTVEMMVNMDNLGNGNNGNFNNQCIFNAGGQIGAEKQTSIFVRFGDAMIPGNKLQIKLCGNVVYESNLVFNKNEWYHLAFVYTGSKFRVYIDGELDKETDASYGTFRLNKGNIFSVNGSSGYFRCNMKIREVRFWNCHISQTQIKDNMYAVDPHTEGLQGYWKMNEGSGKVLHDATGHGNDGMIEGNTVTWIENVRSDQKSDAR